MNYTDVVNTFEELFGYSITDMPPGEIGDTEISQFFEAIRQVDPQTDTDITLGMLDTRISFGDQYADRFRANFAENPQAFVQDLDEFVTKLGNGDIEPEAGFHQFLEERVILGTAELPGGQDELKGEAKEAALAERQAILETEAKAIGTIAETPELTDAQRAQILEEKNLDTPSIEAMTSNIEVASASIPKLQELKGNFDNAVNIINSPDTAPSMNQPPSISAPAAGDSLPSADTTSHQTAEEKLATMSRPEIEEAIGLASQNGGGDYESYRSAFIAMEPEYKGFFDGIDAQTSAANFNPIRDQLTQALNTDPTVGANLVLIGRDPAQLEALTTLVTNDQNPETFLRDEAEMRRLIESLAQTNGEAPLVTSEPIQSIPELVETQAEKIEQGHIDEAPSSQTPTPLITPDADKPPSIENLKDGEAQVAAIGKSPASCYGKFNECVTPVAANVNAEPAYQNHVVEAGQNLDSILQDKYGLEAGGMSYRASLIVAQANGLTDPNMITQGQELKIPSLSSLQEIAGENISLKNLGKHPAELGQQLKSIMDQGPAQTATAEGGAYASMGQQGIAAAAPNI
jgi:hypothetical protein